MIRRIFSFVLCLMLCDTIVRAQAPGEYLRKVPPEVGTRTVTLKYVNRFDNSPGEAILEVPRSITGRAPLIISPHPANWTPESNRSLWSGVTDSLHVFILYPTHQGKANPRVSLGSPRQMGNLESAIDAAVSAYPIDKSKIYAAGLSQGAIEALLLAGRHPERFAGVLSINPIADFSAFYQDVPSFQALLKLDCGGPPETKRSEYDQRSPLTYARQLARLPVTMYWADNDEIIPHGPERQGGVLGAAIRAWKPVAFTEIRHSMGHGYPFFGVDIRAKTVGIYPENIALLAIRTLIGEPRPSPYTEYSAKGARISVALKPNKTTVLLGEPLHISLVVKNVSAQPLQIMVGKDVVPESGNEARFIFSARRSDGLTVLPAPLPLRYVGSIDYMTGPNKIPAHSEYRIERFLPSELMITAPGKYKIFCRKRLEILRPGKDGGWDQTQKSEFVSTLSQTEITVQPKNAKALGEVIDRLGTVLTAAHPDESGVYESVEHAFVELNAINDTRAIKWFVTLLEKRNSTYKGEAIQALAKYDSQIAFNAIISALSTIGADLRDWTTATQKSDAAQAVRQDAARALAASPYRAALDALYALRRDPNKFIRLQVVHTAGARTSAESTAILMEMVHDRETLVSDEASRYLLLRVPKN